MRRVAILCAVALLSAVGVGCRDSQEPRDPRPSFATGGVGGGGFDNASNVGSIPHTNWPPSPWQFPSDIGAREDRCYVDGLCAAGDLVSAEFSPFGTIGFPNNADPNPGACVATAHCFAVLSTVNFVDANFANPIIVLRSGIQATFPQGVDPAFTANTGWVLSFDYAFMTAPPVTASSGDAFAVVLLDYDADNDPLTPDVTVEAFRISRSDLQSGQVPVRAGGCGSNGLGGVTSDYPLCTGWQNQSVDVSMLAGKKVRVRVYVDEGGTDAGVATSLALDNLKFEETVLVGPVTGPAEPLPVNTVVNASANFTDTEVLSSYTATIDWGDGTSSAGDVTNPVGSSPGSVSGSHTYTAAGVYSVTISVSDGTGPSGTSTFDFVVVFDQAGGVAGLGWIDSPAGAYTPDPSVTGRARFAFVSRYPRGSTEPKGVTCFRLHAANLRFSSTSYTGLTIVGAKAQYSGVGTINGGGDVGLLVTAIDGQRLGGGGVDKLRVKIWRRRTSRVVYDNQAGAPDGADPTTPLGRGRIVIRTR